MGTEENKYQQILKLSYVFNLVHVLMNKNESKRHIESRSEMYTEIVKVEDLFYIKDSNKNLYLIQKNLGGRISQILNTCIHFECYKDKPLKSYLYFYTTNILNSVHGVGSIDCDLFKQLQLQYIIDKSYFSD